MRWALGQATAAQGPSAAASGTAGGSPPPEGSWRQAASLEASAAVAGLRNGTANGSFQVAALGGARGRCPEPSTGRAVLEAGESTVKKLLQGTLKVGLAPLPGGSAVFWIADQALSLLFPKRSVPCSSAYENWGGCVWKEVQPFVEEYLNRRLDERDSQNFLAKIRGFKFVIDDVRALARGEPDRAAGKLDGLYDDMNQESAGFLRTFLAPMVRVWLAPFASLHLAVMAMMLRSGKFDDGVWKGIFVRKLQWYIRELERVTDDIFGARNDAITSRDAHKNMRCGHTDGVIVEDTWPSCRGTFEVWSHYCYAPPCFYVNCHGWSIIRENKDYAKQRQALLGPFVGSLHGHATEYLAHALAGVLGTTRALKDVVANL